MATLFVIGRAKVDTIQSSWSISVGRVWFITPMDKGSEWNRELLLSIDGLTCKNRVGAVVLRDTTPGWKEIQ